MINKEILNRVEENNQNFKNKQFTWIAFPHGSLLLLAHVLISLPYAGTAVMGSCKSLQNFPSLYRNIFQYESKAPLCSVLRHGIESAYVPWPFLARLTAHIYSFMRVSLHRFPIPWLVCTASFVVSYFFHLFYIPNPVSPPSPPPLFVHSSTSPLSFSHPPFLCFCSWKGKPPMWVNRAWHIRLKQDQAALLC